MTALSGRDSATECYNAQETLNLLESHTNPTHILNAVGYEPLIYSCQLKKRNLQLAKANPALKSIFPAAGKKAPLPSAMVQELLLVHARAVSSFSFTNRGGEWCTRPFRVTDHKWFLMYNNKYDNFLPYMYQSLFQPARTLPKRKLGQEQLLR